MVINVVAVAGDAVDLREAAGEVQFADVECACPFKREMIARTQGKDSPGEIIFVAVEGGAQICAHHGEKMLHSATEAKLGIGRLPIHFRRAAALEIPQNDKAVTHAADPCAACADVD